MYLLQDILTSVKTSQKEIVLKTVVDYCILDFKCHDVYGKSLKEFMDDYGYKEHGNKEKTIFRREEGMDMEWSEFYQLLTFQVTESDDVNSLSELLCLYLKKKGRITISEQIYQTANTIFQAEMDTEEDLKYYLVSRNHIAEYRPNPDGSKTLTTQEYFRNRKRLLVPVTDKNGIVMPTSNVETIDTALKNKWERFLAELHDLKVNKKAENWVRKAVDVKTLEYLCEQFENKNLESFLDERDYVIAAQNTARTDFRIRYVEKTKQVVTTETGKEIELKKSKKKRRKAIILGLEKKSQEEKIGVKELTQTAQNIVEKGRERSEKIKNWKIEEVEDGYFTDPNEAVEMLTGAVEDEVYLIHYLATNVKKEVRITLAANNYIKYRRLDSADKTEDYFELAVLQSKKMTVTYLGIYRPMWKRILTLNFKKIL